MLAESGSHDDLLIECSGFGVTSDGHIVYV